MRGETRELWMTLCEQAAVEQDPNRLLQLVKRINDLLEQKENAGSRLQASADFNRVGSGLRI